MNARFNLLRRSGKRRAGRGEKGLSLIELMISMVIGLVVVGAVIVSIVGTSVTGRYQSAFGQMNEDAQIALGLLKREIELAGYSQPTSLIPDPLIPLTNQVLNFANLPVANEILGCDRGFVNVNAAVAACLPNGSPGTPSFLVGYEADAGNTQLAGVAPGVPSDCLGNAVAVGPPFLTSNRYFVSTTASGRPELRCASQGTTQPLVENIESMRIFYGMSVPANPTQVVRYVTPDQILLAQWPNVISARICLIVRSAEPVLNGEENASNLLLAQYLDCDLAPQTSADRFLRRAYFTTATIRNRMPM